MGNFQNYLSQLPSTRTLSEVKLLILKRLWHDDFTPFPKPWVSSDELLQLTGQKYFDRRTRELRDGLGCDIESSYSQQFSGHAWRFKSDTIALPQNREYLTDIQKTGLFTNYNYTCAVCGLQAQAGIRGLQADHKVPLSRGGGNDISNWQPLCHNCNIGKRRACSGCTLFCEQCSWAFPEKHGVSTMVNLSEDALRKAERTAIEQGITLNDVLNQALLKS